MHAKLLNFKAKKIALQTADNAGRNETIWKTENIVIVADSMHFQQKRNEQLAIVAKMGKSEL